MFRIILSPEFPHIFTAFRNAFWLASIHTVMLCAELGVAKEAELSNQPMRLADMSNYRKAIRFADSEYRELLEGYTKVQQERAERYRAYAKKCYAYAPNQRRISCGLTERTVLRKDGAMLLYNSSNEQLTSTDPDVAASLNGIVAVSTGYSFDGQFGEGYVAGLKKNGTVIAFGNNSYGQCDVTNWSDIVSISASNCFTVGVESDGLVVTAGKLGGTINGDQLGISEWYDIVSVAIGLFHVVGLKSDGTVVAKGYGKDGQCAVDDWHDIVAVAAGKEHTVGLRADGTVTAVGSNGAGQCNVTEWRNIIAVSAGSFHTVGLQSDRRVVAVGKNENGQCNTNSWHDILAISAGCYHTIGLKEDSADGSPNYVVAEKESARNQQNTRQQQDTRQQQIKYQDLARQWREQGLCYNCGGKLSIITKRCKTCGIINR